METTKVSVRVNYREVAEDPSRRCGDCFFFQRTPEGDDGNCFGHAVREDGTCDAHAAAGAALLGVSGAQAAGPK